MTRRSDDDDDLFQPVFVRRKKQSNNQPTAKESSPNPPAAPKDVTTTTISSNRACCCCTHKTSCCACCPADIQSTITQQQQRRCCCSCRTKQQPQARSSSCAIPSERATRPPTGPPAPRETLSRPWPREWAGRAPQPDNTAPASKRRLKPLVMEKKKESSSSCRDNSTHNPTRPLCTRRSIGCLPPRLRAPSDCARARWANSWRRRRPSLTTCKFSKETRRRVKERVAHLLQQQQLPAIRSSNDDDQAKEVAAAALVETAAASSESSARIPDSEVAKETENASVEEAVAAKPRTRPTRSRTLRSTSEQQLQQQPAVAAKDSSRSGATSDSLLAEKEDATATTQPLAKSSVAPQPIKPKKVADPVEEESKKDEFASDKPKKAAPRRRRQPKAATAKTTASLDDTTATNMNACEHSDPAPSKNAPAKGRKRGRAAATSCSLCAKCPCRLRSRDSSSAPSSNTIGFAQSDAAIEKALIKRLLKLEETTDQYDEQTDAVRRRLKKHRRDVWKKREDLLRRYDEQEAKRKGASASSSRFLPDVDEFNQYLETEHRQKKRRTAQAVAKGQAALFGTVRAKTVQPTLTQMLGGGSDDDNDDGGEEEQTEASPEKKQKADACDSDGNHQSDEESSFVEEEEQLCEPPPSPVKAHRIEPKEIAATTTATAPQSDDNADRSSIWDAVRHGNYTSSWDRLFHEETDDLGVDHLLGLLGSTQEECVPSPESEKVGDKVPALSMMSQSSLSTRGRSLAEEITDQICADERKRAAVERVCPNWKENVAFAMGRKNEADVSEALQNVRDTQAKLRQAKLQILQNIERQEAALGIFEESLQQSLTRFSSATTTETPGPNNGGTQPMMEVAIPAAAPAAADGNPEPRQSIAGSEVGTILSSPLSPGATSLSAVATGESKPLDCFAETAGNEEAMMHCHPHHPGTPLSVAASPEPLAVASQ